MRRHRHRSAPRFVSAFECAFALALPLLTSCAAHVSGFCDGACVDDETTRDASVAVKDGHAGSDVGKRADVGTTQRDATVADTAQSDVGTTPVDASQADATAVDAWQADATGADAEGSPGLFLAREFA